MDCKIDQSKYGVPMPWIGLYITAASIACSIAMLGDFIWGIHRRRLWFPCKLFSLNATSLTLIAIAAKLPVDLNNPMPAAREQLAKLSGTVFLCITMANFMTSLANMKDSDVILNVVPLGILVITVVVNVSIQMGTGVIHAFLPEHIITICFLVILLMFTCNAALGLTYLKLFRRLECEKIHKSMSGDGESHKSVANFRKDVNRYWMAVVRSDPQYLSYGLSRGIASDILCMLEAGMLIQALVRTLKKGSVVHECTSEQASSSDYRWSIEFILFSQVVAVVVGVLGPLYRILQIYHANVKRNFKEFDENIDGVGDTSMEWLVQFESIFEGISEESFKNVLMKLFKDAWEFFSNRISLTLVECSFDHVRFNIIQRTPCRRLIHCSKTVIVGILLCHELAELTLSASLSQLRWMLWLASRPFSLKIARKMQQALFPFTKIDATELKKCLDAEEEIKDFLNDFRRCYGINRVFLNGDRINGVLLLRFVNANRCIQEKASKNSLICLTNLLKAANAQEPQDPLLRDPDKSSLDDCWALQLVNLTSIAVLMPCTETTSPTKSELLCGIGEGLKYVRFLDKHSEAPINARKAANMVWEDIELYHRWFAVDVSKFMKKSPMEVIEYLEKIGKSNNIFERLLGNGEKSPIELARKSMSEICGTIRDKRVLYPFSSAGEAYKFFHSIICNLLAARLMDLREALLVECYRNAFKGQEERVVEVASLLSKAEKIVEVLEKECPEHPVNAKWKI